MYFSVGGHPAFRCPLEADLDLHDYYLEFNKTETSKRQLLNAGLRTGKQSEVLNNTNTLVLSQELFEADALIFSNLASDQVHLKTDKSEHGLTFTFNGFPYLGIWSKAGGATSGGAPFVCIEPWHGLADTEEGQKDFKDKEGLVTLEANQSFSCQYSISCW
jgi:galactose mutarotase-like enzyme